MVIFSLFLFGCDNRTPVEDIRFEENEIVLLVGENYTPNVIISPHYATDKSYTITSLNTRVVSVVNNSITAMSEGITTIRVAANDNSLIEDYITVQVRSSRTTLDAPKNLIYNPTTQTFSFDVVDNASSYTLKINNNIINLGNSSTYSLDRYNTEYGNAYNEILEVSVRANASTYSQAFIGSNYSNTVRIYQNSSISDYTISNGLLAFDKIVSSNNYRISINDEEIYNGIYQDTFDLREINSKFAGNAVTLSVVALPNTSDFDGDSNNIKFYNSLPCSKIVNVMNVCSPTISNTIVSWNNVLYALKYNILINNVIVGETSDNHIDLNTLDCYSDLVALEDYYTINIDPIMGDVENVLKTESKGENIYVNRLTDPVLVAKDNAFTWSGDTKTSLYVLSLRSDEYNFTTNTDLTSFNIDHYPAGQYLLTVQAVGGSLNNSDKIIYLLPSNESKVNIIKQDAVDVDNISISKYVLSFKTTINDKYLVKIGNVVNEKITAISETSTLDLSNYSYDPGENEITITHLGNNAEIFDSAKVSTTFIQLEDIDNINIANGVASVSLSVVNSNAQIEYTIYRDSENNFSVNNTSWAINTKNNNADDYLSSGEYTIGVKVLGDGSNTFSANRTGKIANDTATARFTVLAIPTLSVVNQDTGEISITAVDGATSYNIYNATSDELITNITELSYIPSVDEGSLSLKICAIDDGIERIASNYREITLTRLATPALTHDNATDVINKADNNDSNVIAGYVFKHNGENDPYIFGQKYTEYLVGNNIFTLKLLAVSKLNNKYYLNSNEYTLNVNKINSVSTIWVNTDNKLVISPINQDKEYDLNVKINIGTDEIDLLSNEGRLENDTYSLDLEYSEGSYYIDLFDNRLQPIIPSMITDFSVNVKFTSNVNGITNSEYSDITTIKAEAKAELGRDDKYITITHESQSRTIADFMLLVNNDLIPLDENSIVDVDNRLFKIDFDYILANVSAQDIYDIRVVTLNVATDENSPTFAITSDSIYATQANALEINADKNNDSSNNSVVISFDIETKEYTQYFVLEAYNIEAGEKVNNAPITFGIDNAVDGTISYNLDKFTLTGDVYLSAYISTVGAYASDSHTIQVFNSNRSNELEFTKIASVSNVYVSNGTLYFDAVDNAVGYDIYKEVTGEDEDIKVNTNLITSSTYDLNSLSGESKIKIRAVSAKNSGDKLYTNANVGATISVYKLETPIITIEDGNIALTLSETAIALINDSSVDCSLIIKNGDNTYNISLEMSGVSVNSTKITIEPEIVLGYGETIIEENLNVQLIVNYTRTDNVATYYLNSNQATISKVKGLLSPKNVTKTTNSIDDIDVIENVTWEANSYNVIDNNSVVKGYVMKIRYYANTTAEGEASTYLSTDSKLKYKNGDLITSYSNIITENKALFPYGYDSDGNGQIGEDEMFTYGTFKISVKAVPIVSDTEKLVCSKYSVEYEVKIIATPEISTKSGSLIWSYDNNATNYLITIYSDDFTTELERYTVETGIFDFSSDKFSEFYGLYGVTVQAQSSNKNVLGSQASELIKLFRMASGSIVENEDKTTSIVDEITIEDGSIILTANNYFSSVEIEFVDSISNNKQTLTYSRTEEADKALKDLSITSSWSELTDTSKLLETKKYLIKIYDTEILNIISSRSYTINVKFMGNSNNDLPIINSRKVIAIEGLKVNKLNSSIKEVKTGTFKFGTSYTDDLNYNFNNVVDTNNDKIYWNDVYIYLVTIDMGEKSQDIYCVDYNSLSNLIEDTDYVRLEGFGSLYAYVKYIYDDNGTTKYLYFNVYYNNTIDLKEDYIYYYPITRTVQDGEIGYTGVNGEDARNTINLVQGGSFIVKVALLGGDELNNLAYLTANLAISDPFLRYASNTLGSVDGKVKLLDQREYDENSVLLDTPIYKLTVNPLNIATYSYVYLYYTTEEEARKIIDDDNGIYVQIEYDDYGNIIYDMTKDFVAASYQVKVQTLAGLGENNAGVDYYLNSKEPTTSYVYKKVSDANIFASNGVLQFALSYITEELGNKTYIYDYEITLTDASGVEFIYTISEDDLGVTIDKTNNILTYNIPNSIETDKATININNGSQYTIKVRGVGLDSYVLNGTYVKFGDIDKTLTITISYGIETNSVSIDEGILKWKVKDLNNYNKVSITMTYTTQDGDVQHTFEQTGTRVDVGGVYQYHYYKFEDTKYRVDGSTLTEYIDAGKEYTLSMHVIGTSSSDNAILNSNVEIKKPITRLAQVDNTQIKSMDGILTWAEVEGAIKYLVTVTGNKTYTYTTIDSTLDMTKLDDNNNALNIGDYVITIKAIGDTHISAMTSLKSATFTKLGAVTGITIDSNDNSYFTWDPIDNAQGYKIIFNYDGASEPITTIESLNKVKAPDSLSGSYTVTVSAVGVGEGTVFNGDSATYTSSTDRPAAATGMDYYVLDDEKLGYRWTVTDDFKSSDSLEISYNLRPYEYVDGQVALRSISSAEYHTETYTYDQVGKYYIEDGVKYYYFVPSVMGLYYNFSVKVYRNGVGGMSSASIVGGELDLQLYSYGAGEQGNEYRLSNANQLLNIKFYPNAHYIMTEAIDLSTIDIASQLTKYGAIIFDTFTGSLDGNNLKIIGLDDLNLTDTYNFALFNTLDNAKIKNLVFDSVDSQTNIANTFANSTTNVIKLSLIAISATNSTEISNIRVNDFVLDLSGNIGGQVYIAGLVSEASGTTISNCEVKMTLNLKGIITSYSYIGSMIAKANKCTITANESSTTHVNLTIQQASSTSSLTYVGGVVGQLTGEDARSSGIYNMNSIVSFIGVRAVNMGAIVGQISYATIDNVTSSGTISNTSNNNSINFNTNIGGIAGAIINSIVKNSTSNVSFDINISNTSKTVYIGAYVGKVSTENEKYSEVSGCSTSADIVSITELSNIIDSLGAIGYKDGGSITVT